MLYYRRKVSQNRVLHLLSSGKSVAPRSSIHPARLDRLRRIVLFLSKRVPGRQTCLIDALTLRKLLQLQHIPGSIILGVDRSDPAALFAHAWVMVEGRIIYGQQEASRFNEVARFSW